MLRYLKYFRFSLNLIRKSLVKVALRVTIATMIMMVVMMMMMILGGVFGASSSLDLDYLLSYL